MHPVFDSTGGSADFMIQNLICSACETHMPVGFLQKEECPICLDDRQYVPQAGQLWTRHEKLLFKHSVRVLQISTKVHEFCIVPQFAIGQRAFFLETKNGNILWDCIPLLTELLISFIKSRGGLQAVAISHPHYYSNMNEWAKVFDCPIYLHQKDEEWVLDQSENIKFWNREEMNLLKETKLINLGGHLPGSSILYYPQKETIFCGDTFYISPSLKHAAIMYSYPNRIPLPISAIETIKERVKTLSFSKMYGFYSHQNITAQAKEIVLKSLDRYSN